MTRHPNLDNTIKNSEGLTFQQWYDLADEACIKICGLDIDSLADGPSWSNWEAGTSPEDYAREQLRDDDLMTDELAEILGL